MIQPYVEARVSNAADSKNTYLLPKLGVSQTLLLNLQLQVYHLLEGHDSRFFKARTAFYYVFMQ